MLGVQAGLVILCVAIPLGWVPAFFGKASLNLPGGWVEIIVGLWMVLAGVGTGVIFPLACGLRSLTEHQVGTVAGQVDAADHLGAAVGALLAGAFLVPMLGLSNTGALLAVMQGSVFLFVAICIIHPKARP
jgi:predicted membrane-bound spermidine synthase